jgi:hypothetical protein
MSHPEEIMSLIQEYYADRPVPRMSKLEMLHSDSVTVSLLWCEERGDTVQVKAIRPESLVGSWQIISRSRNS